MTIMTTEEPAAQDRPSGPAPDLDANSGARGDGARARGARGSRARRWAAAVVDWVRHAPGTYLWLLILGANTFALVRMSPRFRKYFLITHSTNLLELGRHPIKVLIASAFWTETPSFLFWFVVFTLFSAPVERWIGTWRWLAVVAIAHIGATLVSEGAVALLIDANDLPARTAHTIDIGVSYALSGSVGVLTYFFARPLRWYYLGGAGLFYLVLLATYQDFTNLGHLTAYLLGLACYRIVRDVPGGDWCPRVFDRWAPVARILGRPG